jgi:serine/threonine protein kinase
VANEQGESIDLMPIEKRQSVSKAQADGDGDAGCLLGKEKLFTTLSSPEAWKADQRLMAAGRYALPAALAERYALMHLIGEGSFGFVWAAKGRPTGEDVAIKFAHRERIADDANWVREEGGRRVLREVAMLQSLRHPSVIRLVEWHETAHYIVIVTERFGTPWTWPNAQLDARRNEGLRPAEQLLALRSRPQRSAEAAAVRCETPSDLFECIEAHYYMPEGTVYRVFSQLLGAVLHLHAEGVLHRDLKDENILVDAAYRIKLIDFGSAARIPVAADGTEDYYRQFNGTLAFAAPEIVRGLWYRGSLAEVWTLGVLLYTLRWRRSPFPDCAGILEGEPAELRCGDRPGDSAGDVLLRQLLRRMLEKRPSRRIPLDQIAGEPWLGHCRMLYSS